MTYAQLLSSLMGWIRKPEAEQSIQTFIELAEAQIGRELTKAGILGATQRTLATIDNEYETSPGDMALPIRLALSTGEVVQNITLESIETLKARNPTRTGKPCQYTLVGRQMRFYPVPDQAYTGELDYQAKLPALGPTVSSNWVSLDYPDVYLYGALTQAGPWLDDEPRLKMWSELFTTCLAEMVKAEQSKRGSRATPGFRVEPILRRRTTFNIQTGY